MKISEIILLPERDGWRLKRNVRLPPARHAPGEAWAGDRAARAERHREAEN
jgi:hypothetical protein